MKQPLVEKIDFYYNAQGYMVFTEKFHLDTGLLLAAMVQSTVLFNYEKVPEPEVSTPCPSQGRRKRKPLSRFLF